MLFRSSLFLLLALFVSGCASTAHRVPTDRSFEFDRDTFAFANELLWVYEKDPETGKTTTHWRKPRPEYHHYCFPMVRAARQFYDFARFAPELPRTNIAATVDMIDTVLHTSPRKNPEDVPRVMIPGYAGSRELSADYEANIKREIGGNWQSWVQRGNWRMVLPFTRSNQAAEAETMRDEIRAGQAVIVHLLRFPALTINHAALLFGVHEREHAIEFDVYDPNTADHPLVLTFKKSDRTFYLPPTPYWHGGRVDVYEVFKNAFY